MRHLSLRPLGDAREVLPDLLAGMGKRRIRMGEIRGPHVIVLAEQLLGRGTGRIVLKCGPHLATEVLPRSEWQACRGHFTEPLVEMVHAIGGRKTL